MTRKMILLEMLDQMLRFLRRFFAAMQRQIAIVLAIATYENNRKSTGTSLGSWEAIVTPLQIMLFFIVMRVGFSFCGEVIDTRWFNRYVFQYCRFHRFWICDCLPVSARPSRRFPVEVKSTYLLQAIQPLDVLLALLVNDFRAISTISLGILGLVWYFTWSFQLDSPGLAISVYLLTTLMALGFGVCLVFLGQLNKWVTRIVKRILQRVIIFTSGIFFATFELPEYTRPFVTWNPILHAVELFRYSINNKYPIPDISLSYLVWCSIVLFGFSLILYRTNESLLLRLMRLTLIIVQSPALS